MSDEIHEQVDLIAALRDALGAASNRRRNRAWADELRMIGISNPEAFIEDLPSLGPYRDLRRPMTIQLAKCGMNEVQMSAVLPVVRSLMEYSDWYGFHSDQVRLAEESAEFAATVAIRFGLEPDAYGLIPGLLPLADGLLNGSHLPLQEKPRQSRRTTGSK